MNHLKFILLGALVIGSIALALLLQRRGEARAQRNDALLDKQAARPSELGAQHEELSRKLSDAPPAPANAEAELVQLRARAQDLAKQTNQLTAQLARQRQSSSAKPKPTPRPPEYYAALHRAGGAKGREAKDLSAALLSYAWEHGGQFPSNLAPVMPYLTKQGGPLSGTNDFELVYRGSLEELQRIPGGAVALLRDRGTFIAPSGKKARVYGLANGSSVIIESDDDFQEYEAEHIVQR